ncbi:MAG: hypothetical protein Q8P00_04195 [Dehalococcoidia bacterium]|nr:hypothetical protein [Dehalococcoidia bacterium]
MKPGGRAGRTGHDDPRRLLKHRLFRLPALRGAEPLADEDPLAWLKCHRIACSRCGKSIVRDSEQGSTSTKVNDLQGGLVRTIASNSHCQSARDRVHVLQGCQYLAPIADDDSGRYERVRLPYLNDSIFPR